MYDLTDIISNEFGRGIVASKSPHRTGFSDIAPNNHWTVKTFRRTATGVVDFDEVRIVKRREHLEGQTREDQQSLLRKTKVYGSVIRSEDYTVVCDIQISDEKNMLIDLPKDFFPGAISVGTAISLEMDNLSRFRKPTIKIIEASKKDLDHGTDEMNALVESF